MKGKILLGSLMTALFFLAGTFPCLATDDNALTQIARANDFYAKTQYKEAAALYQNLVDGGWINGYLYYNLGNTYMRLGQTGPSVLNYIRARRFLPRDENLAGNLNHAIQNTRDKLEPPPNRGLSAIFFWVNNFNRSEHLNFLLVVNLLFWSSLGAWIARKNEIWKWTQNTLMTLLVLALLSYGIKIYSESHSLTGVILSDQMAVKSARGENNITLFQLHEGAIVSIIDRDRDWVRIELNDGKKGWAQKKFIGI